MEQAVWVGEEAQRTRASATNSGDLRSIPQDPRSRRKRTNSHGCPPASPNVIKRFEGSCLAEFFGQKPF